MNPTTLDENLYPGSNANFNNAGMFIKAYYVDKDILSVFQDNYVYDDGTTQWSPPQAIGQRIELVGPYHGIVVTIESILTQGASDLWFAYESHLNSAVLYGLLVQNGYDALGYSF